jgi:deoxycytidylate deaminase
MRTARNRKKIKRPELIIGLVAAVGTDLSHTSHCITKTLADLGYVSREIRLIKLLKEFEKWSKISESPVDEYISLSMNAGNDFRKSIGVGDALVALAISKIRNFRSEINDNDDHVLEGTAYILRSLKNPAEVETLRRVYGESFILIAAFSSRQARLEYLSKRIADSKNEFEESMSRASAESLIQRDQEEQGNSLGQHVRKTFYRADVFVDASNPEQLELQITRFLKLLFGDKFITPARDEFGIFQAKAAALRSAEMGRQVGAAICNEEGEVLAVGTNEVPKANGGFYWEGDDPDNRDFQLGYDSNDKHKKALLADILKRLSDSKLLKKKLSQASINQFVEDAIVGDASPLIRGAQLMNLIEFGRAVHAEMAALSSAAKLGVRVQDTTMYVTTFPCHMCARHIVASGVKRVIYIEPYAKSLASQLYPDSISLDRELNSKIVCEPFVGVGPRRYLKLFSLRGNRKTKDGKPVLFDFKTSEPAIESYPAAYTVDEKECLAFITKRIKDCKLKLTAKGK